MSQYPVDSPAGLYEAVNYLASGPSGLGQNFAGFSDYQDAYLTGNFRKPFSSPTEVPLYVPDIALSDVTVISPTTIKFTFASAQATPPFGLGAIIGSYDITETGTATNSFNGNWSPVGVAECTTTYVIVQVPSAYTWPTYVSGGYVYLTTTGNFFNSTDCNARVTVSGGSDRVFISAQMTNTLTYDVLSSPATLRYTVAVNRYRGFLNNDPVNPDYLFVLDKTVFEKVYEYTGLSGTATLDEIETIFSTILDEPDPGYYWYILEVKYRNPVGSLEITNSKLGLRSLSAQVVKP